MEHRMIFAGAGGQGLMMLGKILAQAAMDAGLNVTWYPSYGAEVRGGTAHCHVVVSEGRIFSPLVERASALAIMNEPSLERFLPRLRQAGLLVLNTSLAEAPGASNGAIIAVPATEIANELKDIRIANMVMLGALNAALDIVDDEFVVEAIEAFLPGRGHLAGLNREAYERGKGCAD